jgi:hypothetical protein
MKVSGQLLPWDCILLWFMQLLWFIATKPVTPGFGFGSISWSGEYRHAVKVSSHKGMTA